MRSGRTVDRAHLLEFFPQLRHVAIEKVGPAEVDKFVRLFCDRLDDLWMAMAGRAHGHAGVAVKEDVSVGVLDPDAASSLVNEFVIGSRITWRYISCISVDYCFRFRAGKLCFDIRFLKFFCRHHKDLS